MRRFWYSYVLSVLLLAVLGGMYVKTSHSFGEITKIAFASPLTSTFTLSQNAQVTSLNIWQPSDVKPVASSVTPPDITGTSVLSYDMTTDKVLYEKNAAAKMPMASLTKLMTAIVSLEHPKADDKYVVHANDLVGEDSMGLDAGEVLSRKELLYGLILHSGNDAAEVLASNYSEGRKKFIAAMNDKAQSLGLTSTHFTNPTGLQGDGDQYTTARDLLVIAHYAMTQFPEFADVAATVTENIPQTSTHKAFDLENETNLMTSYPGVKGVKTGYTDEAGLCLITYLDYGGHQVIAVLLNSQNRRDDMKQILDYSLEVLGITPPHHD